MRENPVKRKLAGGGIALGTMAFEFNSTGLARLIAGAGAEFCVFDQEHTIGECNGLLYVMRHQHSSKAVLPPLSFDHLLHFDACRRIECT